MPPKVSSWVGSIGASIVAIMLMQPSIAIAKSVEIFIPITANVGSIAQTEQQDSTARRECGLESQLDDQNQISIVIIHNNYSQYYNRAHLKLKLGDFQGALANYNKAIEMSPDYADAYFGRSLLKKNHLNDRDSAINDMRQAARAYQQLGNIKGYQKAIDMLKQWQQDSRNENEH